MQSHTISRLRKKYNLAPEPLSWQGNPDVIPKEAKRILVVQTAFLGDLILSTPFFAGIKQLYPQAILDVVVIPQTQSALWNNSQVDNILVFDKKGTAQGKKNKKEALRSLVRKFHGITYDLAIIPHRSFTTSRIVYQSKAKCRIAYTQASCSRFIYHIRVKRRKGVHEIERHLDLLAPIVEKLSGTNRDFIKPFSWQTRIFPDKNNFQKAEKFLKKMTRNKRIKVRKCGIAPGSVYETKKWPGKYYAQLIELLDDNQIKTILLGGPEDQKLCEEIAALSGRSPVIAAGHTSILDSAAIIKQLDMIYCNDSAPGHLANAMDTPVISFFGPTSPIFGFGPYKNHDIILEESSLSCQPCRMHGSNRCPQKHFQCMLNLIPEKALDAGLRLLALQKKITSHK
jgi:heptosyltransferase-2